MIDNIAKTKYIEEEGTRGRCIPRGQISSLSTVITSLRPVLESRASIVTLGKIYLKKFEEIYEILKKNIK